MGIMEKNMSAGTPAMEHIYTLEEYLALEELSKVKHEYHDGKVLEMPGGKLNHNAISMNFGTALNNALDVIAKDCIVLSSDMKIYLPDLNKAIYPDVSLLCDPPQFHNNREDIILNPLLIIEVLSDSTEAYDRGEKFSNYCTIPSFREYVLVSQDRLQVESFHLQEPENNLWKHSTVVGKNASIYLFSIDSHIQLKDIYKRVNIRR